MDPLRDFVLTQELLAWIADLEAIKGRWQAWTSARAPERLSSLRRVATIESVGSSTRIEGATLTDAEVMQLLEGLEVRSFTTRSEQEVAGYARGWRWSSTRGRRSR